MQHSDLPIPARALIIEAACDLRVIAVRLDDAPAARRINTLLSALEHGAVFAWDGGALIVGSPSGNEYRVTQAVCSCPNGRAGLHECWHWLSRGILEELTETLIETADNEADEAERAQQLLTERLEYTRQFVAEASAKMGRRLCYAGRYDYAA